jgi:hypothetical protein
MREDCGLRGYPSQTGGSDSNPRDTIIGAWRFVSREIDSPSGR